ncbi:MAG: hypothetical protein ACRDWI_11460 [Jiangellaceae bacterium]
MTIDLDNASAFVATHARVLERRRLDVLLGGGDPAGPAAALAAYRNADGGYGWALEPDLRSPESQPVAALHAFEVLDETRMASAEATQLCDWLESVTLDDGGLPFALPMAEPDGSAPFWGQADPRGSSLHMTSMLAAIAHRVARHDPGVRAHRWLQRATDHGIERLRGLDGIHSAYEFAWVLQFLDAVHDLEEGAAAELQRLGTLVPASGTIAVEGGVPDEALRLLDISPHPNRPLRQLFDPGVVDAELDRLGAAQQDDGGWTVDFRSWSPAGALEWRGYATVTAVSILRAHDRLPPPSP